MNQTRRKWLQNMAALGAVAPFLIRDVLAMGGRIHAQGFRKIAGTVRLNEQIASVGDIVRPGDRVTTGDNSLALFVLGQDAYLLRGNSRLEIGGAEGVVHALTLLAGKMLSVFGKGDKKILLPTATLGIRGTAVYAEVEAQRCYVCTCYGKVDISSTKDPSVRETVTTYKHDAPRYVYASGETMIVKAPVINHTDDELYMLEELVGRLPAFHAPGQYQGGNPY